MVILCTFFAEYDALAKVILSEPDREQTLKKLHDIDQELKDLEATKKKLDSSIEERRKQSHVLINAINQLLYFVEGNVPILLTFVVLFCKHVFQFKCYFIADGQSHGKL